MKGDSKKGRSNERQIGIDPADGVVDDKLGDNDDLGGNYHGHDDDKKQRIPAFPANAGKGVGNNGAGNDGAYGGEADDDEAVEEKASERETGSSEDIPVILP